MCRDRWRVRRRPCGSPARSRRARSRSASSAANDPSTNHVAPLPASVGAPSMRSSMSRRQRARSRFDHDRRRLQIVAALAVGRLAEIVPRAVDRGGAHVQRRDHRASPCGRRGGAARRLRRSRTPGRARRRGRTGCRRRDDRHVRVPTGCVPKPPHRSAVAASVDPPPRPPPCGMRLSIVVTAGDPARSSARATRFVPSVGTPSANGPIAVSARSVDGSHGSNDRRSCSSRLTISASMRW